MGGMKTKTDRQIRIEEKLGTDIVTYIDSLKAPASGSRTASWIKIAYTVMSATGIDVTHETLRTWYNVDRPSPGRRRPPTSRGRRRGPAAETTT